MPCRHSPSLVSPFIAVEEHLSLWFSRRYFPPCRRFHAIPDDDTKMMRRLRLLSRCRAIDAIIR
jgi:hypothetical protein